MSLKRLVGKENGLIEILLLIVFQHGSADKTIIADGEQKSKPQKGVREMYPTYDDIIQNIKNVIAKKGMKQGTVAARAGFSKQDFSNILNDHRKLLRVEYLAPIAFALGVDVNELLKSGKKVE